MNAFLLARGLLLSGAAASRLLLAQGGDTVRVAPIVVTATRIPMDARRLPTSVTVITGDALRALGITSVADALAGVPGVMIAQTGSFGGATSLFLRGGQSNYVKVLIDGVAVNDPGGAFNFGSLTTDNVERIEVVRGPASVLYGPDAVAGVVQIFTRHGEGTSSTEVAARAGTYHSSDASLTVLGGSSVASYSVSGARHQTDGIYTFNNRHFNNVLSGAMHFTPDPATSLDFTVRYGDDQYHYPTDGGGAAVDSTSFATTDRTVLGLDLRRELRRNLALQVALASNETSDGTSDQRVGDQNVSLDDIRRRSVDARVIVGNPAGRGSLTVGGQVEAQDEQSQSQGNFGGFASNSLFAAARRNRAIYGQALWDVLPNVNLMAGGRIDDNQQFGMFGTYRAGVNWILATQTRLRGNAGTAFREPTFFENYASGYTIGNPNLRPERAASWEVAVEQPLFDQRLTLMAVNFSQHFQNMIDYASGTSACGYSYCNVARANASGEEYDVLAHLSPAISGSVGFTHLRTRVITPGFDTSSGGLYQAGQSLIRRPETSWNAMLGAAVPRRGNVDVRVTDVGQRSDRDFSVYPAAPVVLPTYWRVDVGAALDLPHVAGGASSAITLRVENLTDAHYQSVFNFLAPRRTILTGLRLAF